MNLAWCMIALSLVGADDPQSGKPQARGGVSPTIEIKISSPAS
jgi:hypothetical protein